MNSPSSTRTYSAEYDHCPRFGFDAKSRCLCWLAVATKILAALAILGGVCFTAVLFMLHLIRSDLDPFFAPVCFYRQSESSLYLTFGLLLVGCSEIVLAALLPALCKPAMQWGRYLLGLAGVGVVMLALQRVGVLHLAGTLMQAILFPVAMLLIADTLKDALQRKFSILVGSLTLGLFFFLVAAFHFAPLNNFFGLLQKLDIAIMILWSGFLLLKIYGLKIQVPNSRQ